MLGVCGFEVHPVSERVARGRTARVARRVGVFMMVGCRREQGRDERDWRLWGSLPRADWFLIVKPLQTVWGGLPKLP